MPPAHFLPDSDDPHFRALSEFVVSRAIKDWFYFIDGYAAVELAVNLPAAFLSDPGCVDGLRARLPRHPAFHGLIVEVDGSEIVRDPATVADVARRLRFDNVSVSIDDLGTEWPQLLGMSDFPFAEIKVDREFVSGCADDRLKQSVCRRIIELAETYGARTVAEGVETRADFLAARDLGFDMVLGFLFAKPMGAKKFARSVLREPVVLKS